MTSKTDPMERFMDKVSPEPNTGCWLWTGALTHGYGMFSYWPTRHTIEAHRWIMEQEYGPVPPDKQVDHICRVRCCVNPRHLRVVTQHENLFAEGSLFIAKQYAERTHCDRGHEFTIENTYYVKHHNGARRCRKCHSDHERQRRKAGLAISG